MSPDRLDLVERDVRDHARIISEVVPVLAELRQDKAVRLVENKHLEERLDRIEDSIAASNANIDAKFKGIYKLGWWVLGAFGAAAISLVANFAAHGGFIVS